MTLKEVFEKTVQFFKDKKIESARLDAELLLSHVLKIDRLQIYLKYDQPLKEEEVIACREAIRRRSQGEPVAYITGEKGFYGELFAVGPGVLVPRPETELVVEEALSFIKSKNLNNPRVLDLGAGTGCIGFSILKNASGAELVSVEKSPRAFEYLKKNQMGLELQTRSQIFLADVMEFKTDLKFDIIVANPPYIAGNDPLIQESVKKFEPHEALFAADDGFRDLQLWSQKYSANLKTPGVMLFEMGHLQGEKLKAYFSGLKQFSDVEILKDLSGLDRVIKAVNNG
jgi:release factor glutamine methyltransferase